MTCSVSTTVHVYVHRTSNYLQITRKTRPYLTGHPVVYFQYPKDSYYAKISLFLGLFGPWRLMFCSSLRPRMTTLMLACIQGYIFYNIRVVPDTDLAGYPDAGYPANNFAEYRISGLAGYRISGHISGLTGYRISGRISG